MRKGQIEEIVWRDVPRTALIRRHMVRRGDIVRATRNNLYIIPLRINQKLKPSCRATIKIKRV